MLPIRLERKLYPSYTKLIGQFLQKQRASGDASLDVDLKMVDVKSRLLKSGMVGKVAPVVADDNEEYDPFFDEDLPGDFKKGKVGVLTALEWLSFVLIVGAFICTLTVPLLAKQVFWGLHLCKWALLLLVPFCGQLVSGWAIRLVVFFIQRNFTLRKKFRV